MPIWMLVVEWLARIILFFLVCLSIWSVSIILERRKFFKILDEQDSLDDLKKIIDSKNYSQLSGNGFLVSVLKNALKGTSTESIIPD
jgi:hypothetical protein